MLSKNEIRNNNNIVLCCAFLCEEFSPTHRREWNRRNGSKRDMCNCWEKKNTSSHGKKPLKNKMALVCWNFWKCNWARIALFMVAIISLVSISTYIEMQRWPTSNDERDDGSKATTEFQETNNWKHFYAVCSILIKSPIQTHVRVLNTYSINFCVVISVRFGHKLVFKWTFNNNQIPCVCVCFCFFSSFSSIRWQYPKAHWPLRYAAIEE